MTRCAPAASHLDRIDGGQRRLAGEHADDLRCGKVEDRVDHLLRVVGDYQSPVGLRSRSRPSRTPPSRRSRHSRRSLSARLRACYSLHSSCGYPSLSGHNPRVMPVPGQASRPCPPSSSASSFSSLSDSEVLRTVPPKPPQRGRPQRPPQRAGTYPPVGVPDPIAIEKMCIAVMPFPTEALTVGSVTDAIVLPAARGTEAK